MTESQVRRLQRAMNDFTSRQKLGFAKLREDGDWGAATEKRVIVCKGLLGYPAAKRTPDNVAGFTERLLRPSRIDTQIGATATAVRAGRKARAARRLHVLRNHAKAFRAPGVKRFDGKPVAQAFIPYLEWAREQGWDGVLTSGWRDPAYSESLCRAMCGAPSCPGRCAGRSSRHSQITLEDGAIDVSSYTHFAQLMAECPLDPKIKNILGAQDPLHFSLAGN